MLLEDAEHVAKLLGELEPLEEIQEEEDNEKKITVSYPLELE